MDCQLTYSTSSPPTIGPEAIANAELPAQTPTASCSFAGGKLARSVARVWGNIIAPARPCTTRKPISSPVDPERPQPREARANNVTPVMKRRLRP